MKKDWLTLLCMTLVCATVMFGIMGLYKLIGQGKQKNDINHHGNASITAFNTGKNKNII